MITSQAHRRIAGDASNRLLPFFRSPAQQQIGNGELLAAASTLERLLLSKPNLDSVRLLYAKTLLMLDDKKAAAREFDILEARSLSPQNTQTLAELKAMMEAK